MNIFEAKPHMDYIQQNAKGVRFYTSLKNIELWLGINLADYDWHFCDIEGAWSELEDPSWITGDELVEKLDEDDYQFIWAVISAFPKGTKPFTSKTSYAEGNTSFFEGIPQKQLCNSLFEIVCVDSSATLFIGLNENLESNLLKNAPGITRLNDTK